MKYVLIGPVILITILATIYYPPILAVFLTIGVIWLLHKFDNRLNNMKKEYKIGERYEVIEQGDSSVPKKGSVIEIVSLGYDNKVTFKMISGQIGDCNYFNLGCSFEEMIKLLPEFTSLPEKWILEVTAESLDAVNNYRKLKNYQGPKLELEDYKYIYGIDGSGTQNKNGNVISFDQFKKWVLKETVKEESKFEVGKWYKRQTGEYVKFLQLNTHTFGASELIDVRDLVKWKKFNNLFCGEYTNPLNTYTLLTDLSEIQEYLPEGHVDKLTKKQEVMSKFRIGDSVKCTKEYGHIKVGDKGAIVHILSNIGVKWERFGGHSCDDRCESGYGWYVPEENLQLVSANSLVGRYVKALVDSPCGGSVKSGEYGIIIDVNGTNANFPSQSSYELYTNKETWKGRLELMPEGFVPEKKSAYDQVVHCTTEKEWDFVKSFCNDSMKNQSIQDKLERNLSGLGISVNTNSWSSIDFWKKNNAKIYSFQEWCDKFGHKPEPFKQPVENWCVFSDSYAFTAEIGKYLTGKYPRGNDPRFNGHGLYYGVKDGGLNYSKKSWGQELTREEFYAKMSKIFATPEWIPKVGDWVKRIKDDHLGMEIGDIDQITKVEGTIIWLKKFQNKEGTGSHSLSNLVLATPEEIAKVTKVDPNEGFIKGEWYKCSCNQNYYRFYGINDKYFEHDAQINPTSLIHGNSQPGYTERIMRDSLREYYNPSNKATKEVEEFFNKKESIPEYVECILGYGRHKTGQIFDTKDNFRSEKDNGLDWETILVNFKHLEKGTYKPSTKAAYDAQFVKKEYPYVPEECRKESLLEEAKKRYPIGTKIKDMDTGKTVTVKSFDNVEKNGWFKPEYVIVDIEEHSWQGSYLYSQGKWAEIISETYSELLKKAKQNYPAGTDIFVEGHMKTWHICTGNMYWNPDHKRIYDDGFIIYNEKTGRWAEIISEPTGWQKKVDPSVNKPIYKVGYGPIDKNLVQEMVDFSINYKPNNEVNIVVPKSASVTLKNSENEVKIKVNVNKTILIN